MILDTRCLRHEGVLLFQTLPGLQWSEVAPERMAAQALSVVEGLHESEDVRAGAGPVGPATGPDLLLQQSEERLGSGIVEAGAGAAHALPQSQPAYLTPEFIRGVFTAAVRMHNASG